LRAAVVMKVPAAGVRRASVDPELAKHFDEKVHDGVRAQRPTPIGGDDVLI
jgi:hypothetical protein